MDLTMYKATEMEIWINEKYKNSGILRATDMDLDIIASIFNIDIVYYDGPSFADWSDRSAVIFLNKKLSSEKAREIFFHELCHPLRHVGNQVNMPTGLKQLQEVQAGLFQLYAAIPAYMLEEFREISYYDTYVKCVAEAFDLTLTFVKKRLQQINQRIYQEQYNRILTANNQIIRIQYEYSQETQRIMSQLRRQLSAKKEML